MQGHLDGQRLLTQLCWEGWSFSFSFRSEPLLRFPLDLRVRRTVLIRA